MDRYTSMKKKKPTKIGKKTNKTLLKIKKKSTIKANLTKKITHKLQFITEGVGRGQNQPFFIT